MTVQKLSKLNLFFFLLYLLIQFFGKLEAYLVFDVVYSMVTFCVIFILPGINLVALFQLLHKKKFETWEFFAIASATSLIIIPLILSIEFSAWGAVFRKLPAVNSFIIFLVLVESYFLKKKKFSSEIVFEYLKINKKNVDKLFKSSFFWILIFYFSMSFIIFLSYYPLPDLDPFYWIKRSTIEIKNNSITNLFSDRPLFSSLVYILNQGCRIDLYLIFKYVLPLLSTLVLIPAWLVARKFSSKIIQIVILLFPLSASSTILYSQTPMPQAILNLLTFYFFLFLIYSWFFKKHIFHYLAGLLIFMGIFYHELAIIVFIIWAMVTILFNIKSVFKKMIENKLVVFLLIVIILLKKSLIKINAAFIFFWIEYFTQKGYPIKINFLFPAQYINMNGQSMGWAGLEGVLKYYLFYAGPIAIISILTIIYLFIGKRKEFKKNLLTSQEFVTIILCFLAFFSISEIIPRLLNVAILPERMWIFTGIFFWVFIFFIIKNNQDKIKKIYCLFIICSIMISVGGALYINNLKKIHNNTSND